MEDRRILEAHDGNLPRNVFQIAEEFRTGFEAVDSIDWPGKSASARRGSGPTARSTTSLAGSEGSSPSRASPSYSAAGLV